MAAVGGKIKDYQLSRYLFINSADKFKTRSDEIDARYELSLCKFIIIGTAIDDLTIINGMDMQVFCIELDSE